MAPRFNMVRVNDVGPRFVHGPGDRVRISGLACVQYRSDVPGPCLVTIQVPRVLVRPAYENPITDWSYLLHTAIKSAGFGFSNTPLIPPVVISGWPPPADFRQPLR